MLEFQLRRRDLFDDSKVFKFDSKGQLYLVVKSREASAVFESLIQYLLHADTSKQNGTLGFPVEGFCV